MTNYSLWTLDPMTGEMDRRIADDIDDYEDAEEQAVDAANNQERNILILRDGDYCDIVSPEGESLGLPI